MGRGLAAALAASLVVGTVTLVVGPVPAVAAPGDLDTGFGGAGVVTGFPGGISSMAEGPGGTVTTVGWSSTETEGTLHLRRLTAAGAPDTSFSGDGSTTFATTTVGGASVVHVDASGRTIVARAAGSDTYEVRRLTPGGALDPTFSGDGMATFTGNGVGHQGVNGIGVQPDGDIIIGIQDSFVVGGYSTQPKLVRLDPSGAFQARIDAFDGFTTPWGSGVPVTRLDGTGRPYVAVPDGGEIRIRRFTASLAIDTGYSGDGLVTVRRPGGGSDTGAWGRGLVVHADGVAVVAASVGTFDPGAPTGPVTDEKAAIVARLSPTGSLDPTFSVDGIAALARVTGETNAPTGLGASGGGVVATSNGATWQLTAAGAPEVRFSADGRLERGGITSMVTGAGERVLLAEYASEIQIAAIGLAGEAQPPTGAVFVPVTPCRVVDTRRGGGALGVREVRSWQVGGAGGAFAGQGGRAGGCGIPAEASAVEASVSAVGPSGAGFFRAWPSDVAEPGATFLNFARGQNVTNTGALALAAVASADLRVRSYAAATHYVIDVQGYFTA